MGISFKFVKQKPLEEIDGYCIREDGNIFSAKTGIIIKKHIKNGKEYAWVGCRENKHHFCIPALLEKYFPKEIPEGFVDIKGYEGLYYVNKEGKIYSKARGVNNSKIIVYENNNSINFIDAKPIKEIITPPMLEQIYPYKDELYLVFESPAYAYRYTPGIKIDHIVSINKDLLK